MIKKTKSKAKKIPKGIGGWLILPTIGLFIGGLIWSICALLYGFLLCVGMFDVVSVIIFLVSVAMSVLIIYCIVLEFKKKKKFPSWAIFALWMGVLATLIFGLTDGDFSDLITTTLGAILWTWYFRVSVRVKNTFVK